MMGWVADRVDRFRGRGAHAATVPPMDGTLRPNTRLEEAAVVARIAAPDNLVKFRGQVLISSGCEIHRLDPATGAVTDWRRCAAEVTALAVQDDTLAIALADGSLVLAGDSDRSVTSPGPCVTAMAPGGAGRIVVCVGSSRNPAGVMTSHHAGDRPRLGALGPPSGGRGGGASSMSGECGGCGIVGTAQPLLRLDEP